MIRLVTAVPSSSMALAIADSLSLASSATLPSLSTRSGEGVRLWCAWRITQKTVPSGNIAAASESLRPSTAGLVTATSRKVSPGPAGAGISGRNQACQKYMHRIGPTTPNG